MRYTTVVFMLWAMTGITRSWALVNPDELNEAIPQWLARMYIGTTEEEPKSLYCYGALIDARWVVSSVGCFNDPYRILDAYSGRDQTRYSVRLGNSRVYYEVAERYRAPDAGVMLYELLEPVSEAPIAIADVALEELFGSPVQVLGLDTSAALGHPEFNPFTTSPAGTCTLNGKTFFSEGAWCYLFTYPIRHNKFLGASAMIIDPAGPDRPDTDFDRKLVPNTTGARLHLRFARATTYSCMEDMGMPITRTNANGDRELVGIVNIAGGANGLPVCSGTIANWNTAVGYYRDFFRKTRIEAQFRALCPKAPHIETRYLTPSEVELHWEAARHASGYTVHYSRDTGFEPVEAVALGNQTRVKTRLVAGEVIEAAIQAYNANCTSLLSNRVYLKVSSE